MEGYKYKKRLSSTIVDIVLCIAFLLSISYLGISLYSYKYPYEYNYYYKKIIENIDIEKTTIKKNDYYREYDYLYVQNVEYLYAKERQDLINIMYTFINSGEDTVEFYCSKEYSNCTNDAKALVYDKNNNIISRIYEFSHPFNDYKSMSCGVDKDTNRVIYHVNKKYSKKKIKAINNEVDRLYNELYDPNLDTISNIRNIHDYLVNNIEYDKEKSDFVEKKTDIDSSYDSTSAYGALIEHKAICSGYTDAMYLFLDRMGVRSMRITSKSHIWNAVYLDGEWLHLDLTWDDGRYTSGRTFLSHKYFLIDTPTLLSLDSKNHIFDRDIYKELS